MVTEMRGQLCAGELEIKYFRALFPYLRVETEKRCGKTSFRKTDCRGRDSK